MKTIAQLLMILNVTPLMLSALVRQLEAVVHFPMVDVQLHMVARQLLQFLLHAQIVLLGQIVTLDGLSLGNQRVMVILGQGVDGLAE
jgi:hypothetical protein